MTEHRPINQSATGIEPSLRRAPFRAAAAFLDRQPRWVILGLGIAITVLIGVVDYLNGPQLSASLFYLLPVLLVSWFARRRAGLLQAAAAAATWLLIDFLPPTSSDHVLIPFWNALMRAGVFVVVVLLVSAVRTLHEDLESRVQERTTALQAEINERRLLEKKILEISDREQSRIGQDIHDGLCQHLVSVAFTSNSLEQKLAARAWAEAAEAGKISNLLDEAITQARNLARGLYPVRLEAEGLVTALRELAGNVSERFGVNCEVTGLGDALRLGNDAEGIHLYRIAQEAVNNALKHGKAKNIEIRLVAEKGVLTMTIADDGGGLRQSPKSPKGMGVPIMEYRARMIGARLKIEPGSNSGTQVECQINSLAHP